MSVISLAANTHAEDHDLFTWNLSLCLILSIQCTIFLIGMKVPAWVPKAEPCLELPPLFQYLGYWITSRFLQTGRFTAREL